jgi:hypothetical protein
LAEGYWTIILFVLALFGGWLLAGITVLAVQRIIGLVFPVINEIPANVFKGDSGGKAGLSIFSKDLMGITVNPASISLLEIYLDNPEVADDVLKLNTGTSEVAAEIEVWPEPTSIPTLRKGASGQSQKTNSLAITSLILGLVAIPLSLCLGVGAFFGVAALITGGKAHRQVRESSGTQGGEKMALWGIILGCVGILLGIVMILIVVVAQLQQ